MPIATAALANPTSSMFRSGNVLSDLQNLFSVEGLVAVVTGGGTGACIVHRNRPAATIALSPTGVQTLIDDPAQESGS